MQGLAGLRQKAERQLQRAPVFQAAGCGQRRAGEIQRGLEQAVVSTPEFRRPHQHAHDSFDVALRGQKCGGKLAHQCRWRLV